MTLVRQTALAGALLFAAGLVAAGFGSTAPIAPAAAQGINLIPELQSKSPEERERERKAEEAYKAKLRSIPDQQAADPWGSVRGAAKPAAKPAARAGHGDVDWGALNRKP